MGDSQFRAGKMGAAQFGGSPQTVERIAGSNLLLDYDARFFTPGAGDDVAAAPNQEGTATFDVAEALASKRPHTVTRAAGKAFEYTAASAQQLEVLDAGADVTDASDDPTIIVVCSHTSQHLSGPFGLSTSTSSTGLEIFTDGSNVFARGLMTTGLSTATGSWPADVTVPNIYRATCRGNAHPSPGIIIAVNGVETLSGRNSPGMSNALDSISLGKRPALGSYYQDGDGYRYVALRTYDADQIAAIEKHFQNIYRTLPLP